MALLGQLAHIHGLLKAFLGDKTKQQIYDEASEGGLIVPAQVLNLVSAPQQKHRFQDVGILNRPDPEISVHVITYLGPAYLSEIIIREHNSEI
jgi:hypothetical protein